MIPRDTPDNWYQMDACLTAPNLPQQESQISAMLHTVQIAKGDLVGRRRPRSVMWGIWSRSHKPGGAAYNVLGVGV
jgi:hypothetical protein